MTTHITKTWFDGDKVVTQEIHESEVYKQEPVAWIDAFGNVFPLGAQRGSKHLNEPMKPLYTTPQPRDWVSLTHDERDAWQDKHRLMIEHEVIQELDDLLREKNTYSELKNDM